MPPSVTIRDHAAACFDLFSQAVLLLNQTENTDDQNGLLDEFGRFKLWMSNIGVFVDLHSSLDYRLRDFNDIKDSFTRQLITIENRLQQLLDAAQQDSSRTTVKEDEDKEPSIPTPTKSTEAAMFQDWNNTQLLQSIHQSIDWLHRLSNLVRKASFANQHKRADKFILKDEDDNDMSDILTDYYTKFIKREFGGIKDNLVQRLAASMLMRRKRIMYRRSQQQRWKIPQVEPKTKNLELAFALNKPVPTPLEPSAPLNNDKVVVLKPEAITIAPSRLTVTTIDTSIRRHVSAPSGISKGSTAPLNDQSQLLLPPPPKGANFGDDFVCDYCCLILPSKIALNRNAWADHVNKDLYPYVCVVDKCDDPIEIYSSRKEWLAHMSTRHLMRWYCIAKPHMHPIEFDSEGAFIEHMEIEHPGKFRNDQVSLVAENSSRPKDSVFDDCPFCIGTFDNLEKHVGLHLRDLALRSLPWPDDDERYSQLGEYLYSDNSASNENTRSTIVDFMLKSSKFDTIGIIDDGSGSELNAGERLGSYGHFQEIADQHRPIDLRGQLSDKILVRLAIKKYQDVPGLSFSPLINKLEALLDDEYSQAEDITAIEGHIMAIEGDMVLMQQLSNPTSLDHEQLEEPTGKAMADPDEIIPSGSTQIPRRVFEVAIICTLLTEYDAICLIFDEIWDKDYKEHKRDENTYTAGRVGKHSVVLALFPHTGEIPAAAALVHFRKIYSQLELFLLVGICGGIPKFYNGGEGVQISLGDVVISRSVIYSGLDRIDTLSPGNMDVAREATRVLYDYSGSKSSEEILQLETGRLLFELQAREIASGAGLDDANSKYKWPGAAKDRLFEANYLHKHRITAKNCSVCSNNPNAVCDDARDSSCQEIGCALWQIDMRENVREAQAPMIHIGMISLKSIAVANGLERDEIHNEQGAIAFDMDTFGAGEKVSCARVFIKGVCNYADGHKDNNWQNFAAATAAAATKAFLEMYRNRTGRPKEESQQDFAATTESKGSKGSKGPKGSTAARLSRIARLFQRN